jgi:hypothetical protein
MTDINLWAGDDFYEDGATATKVPVSTALAAKGHRPDTANCSAQEENFLLNQLTARAHAAPDVQIFETSGTWSKPAHAASVHIVLQNAGQSGGNGGSINPSAGGGGGGGAGGSHRELHLPADLVPDTLTVIVPTTSGDRAEVVGADFDAACWASYSTGTSATGGTAGTGGVCTGHSPALFADWSVEGSQGGQGGQGGIFGNRSAVAGAAGAAGPTGIPSAGGATGGTGATADAGGHGGAPGIGYGAGGGGGGGLGSTFTVTQGGGGGGGGGGWGIGVSGAAGGSGGISGASGAAGSGGAGAPGIVVITTWFASEN